MSTYPPPPPPEAWQRPRRVDPVPGTGFGVAYLEVPPVTSGLAVGALVAGIASILLSMIVTCFGLAGAADGWGGWAAGAFAIVAGLAGLAGVLLGVAGIRQIRRPSPATAIVFTGRGLAVAGISCGGVGLALTGFAFFGTLLLQLG